jgi:hypothetical protein
MTLSRGQAAPNPESLASGQGVLEALSSEWALSAKLASDCHCLTPDDRVGNVLREVHLWEPFARYLTYGVDGYKKVAIWMSVVEHKVKCRRF